VRLLTRAPGSTSPVWWLDRDRSAVADGLRSRR